MTRFKAGTFNVLNLALPGQVTYPNDKPYTEDEYKKKLDWIGGQLGRMDADIVGFQEVWHPDALKAAVEAGQRGDKVFKTFVAAQSDKSPHVALATSLDVVQTLSHHAFPEGFELSVSGLAAPIKAFSRPVLQADLKLPGGQELTVLVAHLKSKRPMVDGGHEATARDLALGSARSLIVRSAEAYALRCVLLNLMQDTRRPVILLGDLNDTALSVTTTIISGTPPLHHLPPEKKQPIWDVLLHNAFDIQARQNARRDVSYSHIFNGYYDTLDQIYVSQEFNRLNAERLAEVEYVHYFNDHLLDRTLSREGEGRIQSDHGQVVATLRLKDPGPPAAA
ncbi:endonuclease/exonuclease/phosphatase family protein [Archangium gephyra]|uniref:Endonuclease/exonuclease/phosphatase family protein n=1 Tax=Archangium gephyra TaxID=48 RepID=A0AAC8QI41_9BACT|nr:endonuclease/exonuclease/phosphatase family protein [Archangium gephyra]AKJ07915.1 Endonuclease/exonuclease/phosphatase family protein [Archangium gephyra]REG29663.1 endonuclease/exonuclease/phosphatase family protein [Archangium gephyra]